MINLNILSYALFLTITISMIIRVGKICYINGNVFVLALIPEHKELCLKINQLLLLGYYLLNIGYCAMALLFWDTILTFPQLIEILIFKIGIIVLIIAIMHYINIILISKYVKKLIH